MHESVKNTIAALDAWSAFLKAQLSNPNQPMNRLWGWTAPSLTRADVDVRIRRLKEALEALPDKLEGLLETEIDESPERLTWITNNVLPNIPNGNANWCIMEMYQEFDRLENALDPTSTDWEKALADNLIPKKLASRLRAVEARLADLEPRSGNLDQKIRLIEDATASAEQLPADLQTLAEGREEVDLVRRQVEATAVKVDGVKSSADAALTAITTVAADAEKLFDRLEAVYKAGSTRGLASAFSKKASGLNASLYGWTALLVATLITAAWIGSERFQVLQRILERPITPSVFWANLAFSLLSVAAPIWLAWVSTKQINQRFKLAEDYSFKASVATAYEGYRSEAVRLDSEFEKRLFGSALSRLEEAPLRFVDTENFGTPWHELTSSPAFAKALDLVPDLKATVAKVLSSAVGAAAGTAGMLKTLSEVEKGDRTESRDPGGLTKEG